ncbi:MAG: hypothetical protein ACK5ME_03035 [Parahaliea sp.]
MFGKGFFRAGFTFLLCLFIPETLAEGSYISNEYFAKNAVKYLKRTLHPSMSTRIGGVPVEKPVSFNLKVLDESKFSFVLADQDADAISFNSDICQSMGAASSDREFFISGEAALPLACEFTREAAARLKAEMKEKYDNPREGKGAALRNWDGCNIYVDGWSEIYPLYGENFRLWFEVDATNHDTSFSKTVDAWGNVQGAGCGGSIYGSVGPDGGAMADNERYLPLHGKFYLSCRC